MVTADGVDRIPVEESSEETDEVFRVIHFILGTRAQLIKTAPLMVECRKRMLPYRFIYLAQHKATIYEMLKAFGIRKPHIVLGDCGTDISKSSTLLGWMVRVLYQGLKHSRKLFPDGSDGIAVVHGDALPALLGAILARIAGLKVAHVEAGLRSFNYLHPFPEELIRVMLWKMGLVDIYFCPNEWALGNVKEYRGEKHNTLHNTLLDSLRLALNGSGSTVQELGIPEEKYALVSIHRFETISRQDKMEEVIDIIVRMSKRISVVFVLHPPTKVALESHGFLDRLSSEPRIHLRPRYKYHDFVNILYRSEFVVTDGGSNQEECYYLGHPCLLLRHATERIEGLGKNVIISKFDPVIINEFIDNYQKIKYKPLGADSCVSKLIVSTLENQKSRNPFHSFFQ